MERVFFSLTQGNGFARLQLFSTGPMAERLGKGLQNPEQRFNSASDLRHIPRWGGGMVYARHLKCCARKGLWVRVPPPAQTETLLYQPGYSPRVLK